MQPSPVLEGHFVRLEPLEQRHVAGLAAAAAGPRESYEYTFVPSDKATAERYVEVAMDWQAAGSAIPLAILDVRTRSVVGSTRYFDIQYWDWDAGNRHQRGADLPDAVEIGYTWLAPWAQRTGINTEAKLLMLAHAFETWRVHRVRFVTDARNQRSRAAIQRLGARFDGILRAARAGADGAIRDSAYYSMLDSEWPAAKEALTVRLRLD
jgi:RimJ/RimL family protein N-acetyltransferase